MKYQEIVVRNYAISESGPFIELESGKRIYGLPAHAPMLFEALRGLIQACDNAGWSQVLALTEARNVFRDALKDTKL